MKKKILAFGVALSVMLGMVGCSTAHTVNHNLSKDANEFNIYRRITVTNARTDTVMLQAEGYMALGNNSSNELVVTIKTFDATEQKRKQLETSVQERETQLEELKASAGDNAALKQQIADLQAQNKQKDLDNQKEMNDLKMTYAIRTAVSASAQDSDLVAGLVDRNKLILGDDGKITGLDEQVKALKESKPFLFKAEDNGGKKGFFRLSPKDAGGSGGESHMSMKEAIAAKLNMGSEGKE